MKKPAFPGTLYVKEDYDGDDVFYIADTDVENQAVPAKKIVVGVYQLLSTEEISLGLIRKQITGLPVKKAK